MKKEQALWIDALCIKQGDMNERNHQARHMENIYKGQDDGYLARFCHSREERENSETFQLDQ